MNPLLIGAGLACGFLQTAFSNRRRQGVLLSLTATSAFLLRETSINRRRTFQRIARPEEQNAAASVRILSANLWNGNKDVSRITSDIEKFAPGIVVLQELTPRHLRRLDQAHVFDGFPWRAVQPEKYHSGLGIWSRLVLHEPEWFVLTREPQLRAWIHLETGEKIRIYAVHAPSPVPRNVRRWRRWFRLLQAEVSAETRHHGHPLVLAGDYNATVDHKPFRALLEAGLRDASDVGSWPRKTWPIWRWPVPAMFHLDHILLSRCSPVWHRAGAPYGSDHRPIIAEIAIPARNQDPDPEEDVAKVDAVPHSFNATNVFDGSVTVTRLERLW